MRIDIKIPLLDEKTPEVSKRTYLNFSFINQVFFIWVTDFIEVNLFEKYLIVYISLVKKLFFNRTCIMN